MNRMGFVGYCANAEVGAKPSRTAIRASASKNLRIFPSVLTNLFNVRYGSKAAISIGFVSNTSSKHHHVLASDTVSNLPPNVRGHRADEMKNATGNAASEAPGGPRG